MNQPGRRVSQAVGVALGALILEVVRRRLRADTWDYGHAEARSGAWADRAVVAVTFSPDDFRAVSKSAEAVGTGASQFVHDAALARAQRPP